MAPWVVALVHDVPHQRVLDVGPGHGKYAVLLREYTTPPEQLDAVEAHTPYVVAYDLDGLYDQVFHADVCDLTDEQLAAYDLVLMVDVIEHIDKDAAVALLDRIPGRVVICTPVDFFHNGPGLPDSETHRSHWTGADWEATRRVESCSTQLGGWLVRLGLRT